MRLYLSHKAPILLICDEIFHIAINIEIGACLWQIVCPNVPKLLWKNAIQKEGPNCNLNFIDVSHVTNMSHLFFNSQFTGDISRWDVSNVTDMSSMFERAAFNGDISLWNVSNVENMHAMFLDSQFMGDISQWDVSHVTNMSHMFWKSRFNGDISHWNVSNVVTMYGLLLIRNLMEI